MNKINTSYYRLGIIIGLSLLFILVYFVFGYHKMKKGNVEKLGDCYQNETVVFETHKDWLSASMVYGFVHRHS